MKLWFFKRKKRTIVLRPIGAVYNLQEIYDSLNREYFDAQLRLRISWFGKGDKAPRTRVIFGSYRPAQQLIRVNRLLDKEEVPLHFVRYIVYHEMLHNVHPPKRKRRGRHHIHHPEFKAKEREFKEFSLSRAFIKEWRRIYFA